MRALAILTLGLALAPALAAQPVRVVAAEDFYGDIARQIGGDRVAVTSILANPNIDPHEYEPSVADARAVAAADLVIENGGGYDDWMDKLLSAAPSDHRIVLKAYDVAVKKLPNNEHVWYDFSNMEALGNAIAKSLSRLLPESAALFEVDNRYFHESFLPITLKLSEMASRYAGTPVGLTEPVYAYQAAALRLKVLTPPDYQKAIEEGNDPPPDAVVEAEDLIRLRKIRVLILNAQAVSLFVTRAEEEARAAGIPVVKVTETMPRGESYQTWMSHQLDSLQAALFGGGG